MADASTACDGTRGDSDSSQERLRRMVEAAPTGMLLVDESGTILLASAHAEEMFGFGPGEMSGQSVDRLVPARHRTHHPAMRRRFVDSPSRRLMGTGRNLQAVRKDGSEFPVEIGLAPLSTSDGFQIVCNVVDITERKKLEEQFLQSQKLESIGRLAGGLAHDFNNLLSVILANCGLLLAKPMDPAAAIADIQSIRKAAEQAASITAQLLAVGRKQVMEPKILDVNVFLANMEDMLRRLIGEQVELALVPGPLRGNVRVDPNKLAQVVVNLAVNARDAMPHGGQFTLATADVFLDSEYCRLHVGVTPGPYVQISVTDTGCGIEPALQHRLFEPFYTTKEVGKGTGLGLSTALGIVKQSGGHIGVYSEAGFGTSFKIYLPLTDERSHTPAASGYRPAPAAREATVLVVDDHEMVRDSARKILEAAGYTVLQAGHGDEAIDLAERHPGDIALLLTDVVMPRMNGQEVAMAFAARRPETKVLYMSGYADDALMRRDLLSPGTNYIQKPFTLESLSGKVAEILRSIPSAPGKRPAVLVVDDQQDLTDALCWFLEQAGFAVEGVYNLSDALSRLETRRFELVLTDVGLPDARDDDPVTAVRRAAAGVPIVVMSGEAYGGADPDVADSLTPAAVLVKPVGREELVHTVRRVLEDSAGREATR